MSIRTNGKAFAQPIISPLSEEPKAVALGAGTYLESSILPLNRGANGESIARAIAYNAAVSGGIAFQDTEFKNFLTEIAKDDPRLAARLAYIQNDLITPQFERLRDTRRNADRQLEELREIADKRGKAIDATVAKLRGKRDKTLQPYLKKLQDAKGKLPDLHKDASKAVSELGIVYDPAKTNEEKLLQIETLSEAEAASKLKVPFGAVVSRLILHPIISWTGTIVCGAGIGISAALAGKILQRNEVFEEPNATKLIACALFGIGAVSIFLRGALRLYAAKFIESYNAGQLRRQQTAWFATLAIVVLVLCGSVIALDSAGIVKGAQNAFKTGDQNSPLIYWLMAIALSLAYALYSVAEGLTRGRFDAINNKVQGHREEDLRTRLKDRRAESELKEAAQKVSQVIVAEYEISRTDDRIKEIENGFQELITRAEESRIEWPLEWTPMIKAQVEQERETLIGLHVELNALISDYFARYQGPTAHLRS